MATNIQSIGSEYVESFLLPERFLFIDYSTFKKEGFVADLLNFNAESMKLLNIIKPELTEK